MLLFTLYFEFFKIGLFSIGGGLATIPFLYDLASRRPDWFTASDVADMIAISESTPGPIGVNMATFAGYQSAGIFGGIISTLGLITPAIVIIFIVAKILSAFKDNKYVDAAFYGLRAASIGLVLAALYEVVKVALIDVNAESFGNFFRIGPIILAVILYVIQNVFKNLHPIAIIAIAAAAGIIFKF